MTLLIATILVKFLPKEIPLIWRLSRAIYFEKLCELLGHLYETINSEAQKWERSTAIPKGSRAKRLEAQSSIKVRQTRIDMQTSGIAVGVWKSLPTSTIRFIPEAQVKQDLMKPQIPLLQVL